MDGMNRFMNEMQMQRSAAGAQPPDMARGNAAPSAPSVPPQSGSSDIVRMLEERGMDSQAIGRILNGTPATDMEVMYFRQLRGEPFEQNAY